MRYGWSSPSRRPLIFRSIVQLEEEAPPGSAEQDACRRDLTINSLFYDIEEKIVEDFTGRGIADLKAGRIVTPLPAMDTFKDDPLRVFRAIRFAARFGFVLDDELREAAASDAVREAIGLKMSRERISDEIKLIMSGNRPVQALTDICSLQLFWVFFALPEPNASERPRDRRFVASVDAAWNCVASVDAAWNCVASVDAAWNLLELIGFSSFDEKQRRLYLYSALLIPITREIGYCIIPKYLTRPNDEAVMVKWLHRASERFTSLIPELTNTAEAAAREKTDVTVNSNLPVSAGLLLWDIENAGKKKTDTERLSLWRVALMICALSYPIDFDRSEGSADEHKQIELDMRRTLFTTVENAIVKLGVENVCEMPLAEGKQVMEVLQLKGGGSIVGVWMRKLLEWQLADRSRTSEQSLEWMRERASERPELKYDEQQVSALSIW
ncbi:hypothetical protein MKW94_019233 [Papaver nudicaule]|uniref:Poly A polymerase head domain-containing protein n=1 Tax=Papaver nudicaule TaxID=74823 RepID=A0AA41SDK8_PAPNU|nr:hypothetical protein [Papaver nudicaule]